MSIITTYYKSLLSSIYPIPIADLNLWLKSDAGITISGGNVSQWVCQAPPMHIFAQPSIGARPSYSLNALNGYPILIFGNSALISTNITSLDLDLHSWSFYFVVRARAAQGIILGKLFNNAGEGGAWAIHPTSTRYRINYFDPTLKQVNIIKTPNNTWETWTITIDRTDAKIRLYLNGILSGILPNTIDINYNMINSSAFASIGGSSALLSNWRLNGDIAEMIGYNTIHNTATQQSIELYLKNKYLHY